MNILIIGFGTAGKYYFNLLKIQKLKIFLFQIYIRRINCN